MLKNILQRTKMVHPTIQGIRKKVLSANMLFL